VPRVFGLPGPAIDAEMIAMLVALLADLGIKTGDIEVAVNSLGSPDERTAYRETLRTFFAAHADKLERILAQEARHEPLAYSRFRRIPTCRPWPSMRRFCSTYLGERSKQHFEAVRGHLATLGVESSLDPRLVRGLDYYTGTIFEIKSQGRRPRCSEHRVRRRALRSAGLVAGRARSASHGIRAGVSSASCSP